MKKGFSLIEILVVLAIIIIILAVVLINYRSGQRRGDLDRTAQELVSNLRRVQNMAINTQICEGAIREKYGLERVDSSSYRLYCDSELIEVITLSSGITISASGDGDVYFSPPDPITFSAPQTFTLTQNGQTKIISVSSQGQINVQ